MFYGSPRLRPRVATTLDDPPRYVPAKPAPAAQAQKRDLLGRRN
jgi:hypothetical protein